METTPAKRLEIIIEAPALSRLERALEEAGAKGYTVLPVFGGNGQSGAWTREGEVSGAHGMVAVICVAREERIEPLVEAVFAVVQPRIGVMTVSDCQVLRGERF